MPDLTGIPALDLLIGLSFIFLLLSLFCSAIQELIASLFALRSKTLEQGLRNMLEDYAKDEKAPEVTASTPIEQQPLTVQVLGNPLIRTLYRDTRLGLDFSKKFIGKVENKAPSYIAPRSFALALLDTLDPPAEEGQKSKDLLKTATETINSDAFKIVPKRTRQVLLTLIADGRGDIDRTRQNIEAWFDDSMARVSGWYKRKAQIVLSVIALFVVVGMNVDSLDMGRILWKDQAVRAQVVSAAAASQAAPATGNAQGSAQSTPAAPAAPDPDSDEAKDAIKDETKRLENAAKAVNDVKALGVPLGWNDDSNDPRNLNGAGDWAKKVVGWFLSLIALSLGAPFWFDTLSRLARLRNSGKPETPLPASAFGSPSERVADPAPTPVPVPSPGDPVPGGGKKAEDKKGEDRNDDGQKTEPA